jgi:hypothetical protein
MTEQGFRPGLYRHTKTGGFYTAICLVTHHEGRHPMVLYVSHKNGGLNIRPLRGVPGDPDGFLDVVTIAHNLPGVIVRADHQRFTFVGDLPSDTPIEDRKSVGER